MRERGMMKQSVRVGGQEIVITPSEAEDGSFVASARGERAGQTFGGGGWKDPRVWGGIVRGWGLRIRVQSRVLFWRATPFEDRGSLGPLRPLASVPPPIGVLPIATPSGVPIPDNARAAGRNLACWDWVARADET